jgi:hypothetical protein
MGKLAVITFGIVALWSINDARAICRTVTDCSSGVCHPVRMCGDKVPSYIPPPRVAPGVAAPVPGVVPEAPSVEVTPVIPVYPAGPQAVVPGYGYRGYGYPGYPLGVVPPVGGQICQPRRICNAYGQCSVQQVCR